MLLSCKQAQATTYALCTLKAIRIENDYDLTMTMMVMMMMMMMMMASSGLSKITNAGSVPLKFCFLITDKFSAVLDALPFACSHALPYTFAQFSVVLDAVFLYPCLAFCFCFT